MGLKKSAKMCFQLEGFKKTIKTKKKQKTTQPFFVVQVVLNDNANISVKDTKLNNTTSSGMTE